MSRTGSLGCKLRVKGKQRKHSPNNSSTDERKADGESTAGVVAVVGGENLVFQVTIFAVLNQCCKNAHETPEHKYCASPSIVEPHQVHNVPVQLVTHCAKNHHDPCL